jgi:hypothetical protein
VTATKIYACKRYAANNTPVRYWCSILLKHTDGFHSQDTNNLGMKNSPERNPILANVYLSIPTDGLTSLKKRSKQKGQILEAINQKLLEQYNAGC